VRQKIEIFIAVWFGFNALLVLGLISLRLVARAKRGRQLPHAPANAIRPKPVIIPAASNPRPVVVIFKEHRPERRKTT
jgi:hypothetical protein